MINWNGKIALLKRWCGIIFGKNRVAVQQGVGKFYSKDTIRGYYNDLTVKVNDKTLKDAKGVPINIVVGNKKVYFPISIFQYALGCWDMYIETKNPQYKDDFFIQCKWILENQESDGSWNCFGPIGYKNLTVSSMGQGQAISVLLRAYILTDEVVWKNAAKKAIEFMMKPVEHGGTLRIKGNQYILEEYADVEGKKKGVLNGWIFSLFGVYDYLKIEKDEHIEGIYHRSLNTLEVALGQYDMGFWSYYDMTGRIASPAYHELHSALLTALADLTDSKIFKETAHKWKIYTKNPIYKVVAIIAKAIQKLQESSEGIIIQ